MRGRYNIITSNVKQAKRAGGGVLMSSVTLASSRQRVAKMGGTTQLGWYRVLQLGFLIAVAGWREGTASGKKEGPRHAVPLFA
jgi:hypothetical protein